MVICDYPALEAGKEVTEGGFSGVVQPINPVEEAGWDLLLGTHPGRSFFHRSAWAKVLRDSYGYAPAYFILSESGQLRSLLPVMEVRSWLTGSRGVSLPFTDNCRVLSSGAASIERLTHQAINWGRGRGWKYLELRGGKEFFPQAPASQSYFGHELKLVGEKALFAQLHRPVRTAIRKGQKLGLKVEVSQSLEALRSFYELHCSTRRRHGLPPPPFRFFENVHEHILSRDKGIVVIARHQQQPVAASVYFHSDNEAIYKYSASDGAFQDLRGNNLVMWEAIKWYCRAGFDRLHLGRTSASNSGLRRFKLGWGACEHKIEYLRYDLRKRGFVTGRDEAFGWYNRIFNRLPPSISKAIGSILYRHVG